MRSLLTFVHDKFYVLIMLLIAGGFATLVAELLWSNHTDGIQMVAVIASVAGVVLGLAALFLRGNARAVVAVLFLALSVTGVVGVLEHNEARGGEEEAFQRSTPAAYQTVSFNLQEEDERGEENERGEEREGGERGEGGEAVPPLAPLGLTGLALMGTVVTAGYAVSDAGKNTS